MALAIQAGGAPLDSTALAVLVRLADFYACGRIVRVRRHGQESLAVATTARELALAVLGRADGRAYRALGLVRAREADAPPGSLDKLALVWIREHSTWLDPDGARREVLDAFHLIDWLRWERPTPRCGRKTDRLLVGLSPRLMAEIDERGTVALPPGLVRALPSHGPAGRLGAFVLSHAPLPGGDVRRVSAEACMGAVGVPLEAAGHAGRKTKYLRRALRDLRRIAPEHDWRLEDGVGGPVVVCAPRKPSG